MQWVRVSRAAELLSASHVPLIGRESEDECPRPDRTQMPLQWVRQFKIDPSSTNCLLTLSSDRRSNHPGFQTDHGISRCADQRAAASVFMSAETTKQPVRSCGWPLQPPQGLSAKEVPQAVEIRSRPLISRLEIDRLRSPVAPPARQPILRCLALETGGRLDELRAIHIVEGVDVDHRITGSLDRAGYDRQHAAG
jgi:hypothetical protein